MPLIMQLKTKENMKKLLNKFRKRSDTQSSSRITSDTVAEHRERILAGGRRFKYPLQYVRHKLVFNAIFISVIALAMVVAAGWWQLYSAQNTSEFMYRITKVLPLPVANVDGQPVLYSDYLMKYLSSVHYLEQKEQVSLKSDDGKRQIEYIKQQSMQDAIADAYALKLSKDLGITVSDSDLEGFLKDQRQSSDGEISEQTYDAVILDYYGWSPDEYRHVTSEKLLRQKVAYAIDEAALSASDSIKASVKSNAAIDFKKLAATFAGKVDVKVSYGASGLVPKTNQDGGLALEASKLRKNQVSSVIRSTVGDGYYILRLIDNNDTQVSYEYVKVTLTKFTELLSNINSTNKVQKLIFIPG